jgi:hypothetical protein
MAEYEMDGRIEALVGLKRYELPAEGSLDTFVAEFHRRRRYAEASANSVLARFREKLHDYILSPTTSLLRTAAGAAALALIVGLSLFHTASNHGNTRSESAWVASDTTAVNASVVLANNDVETASYVLPRINGDAGPNVHGSSQFEF